MTDLRGGINIQMRDMGEGTFFADILCNNQMYIVWGGDTRYGLLLISFCCLFDTYVGEGTDIEHTTTTKIKNI